VSPLDKACKAAGKCSSCLVPARWKRRDETAAQLLADPAFIASLPDSAVALGTHLCVGCVRRLQALLREIDDAGGAATIDAKLARAAASP
jgi:hypothetical protein